MKWLCWEFMVIHMNECEGIILHRIQCACWKDGKSKIVCSSKQHICVCGMLRKRFWAFNSVIHLVCILDGRINIYICNLWFSIFHFLFVHTIYIAHEHVQTAVGFPPDSFFLWMLECHRSGWVEKRVNVHHINSKRHNCSDTCKLII